MQFETEIATQKLREGREQLATYLESTNGDINFFRGGLTLLQRSAISSETKHVEILVQLGANMLLPNNRYDNKQSAFQLAVRKGHSSHLEIMLPALQKQGRLEEGLGSKDAEGNTALHLAAAAGSRECVELLLKYGADPSLLNGGKKSAAAVALEAGHADISGVLMEQSRAPRKRIPTPPTPKSVHSGSMSSSPEDHESGVLTSSSGNSGEEKKQVVYEDRQKLIEALRPRMQKLLDASLSNDEESLCEALEQEPALPIACINAAFKNAMGKEFYDIAKILLLHNADINTYWEGKMNQLHMASCDNAVEQGEFLLRNGAAMNLPQIVDDIPLTPLHIAGGLGHFDFVKLLVKFKVHEKYSDEEYASAVKFIRGSAKHEIAKYLEDIKKPKAQATALSAQRAALHDAVKKKQADDKLTGDVKNDKCIVC